MHPDFEVYSIYGKGLVKICLMHILYLCFHGQICLFFIASRNLLHLENAFTNAWMSSCLQSSSTSEIESESLSLICDPPPMAQAGYVKSPWDLKMNLRKPSSMRLKRVSFRIHQSYMINGLFSTPFQIMFEKKRQAQQGMRGPRTTRSAEDVVEVSLAWDSELRSWADKN